MVNIADFVLFSLDNNGSLLWGVCICGNGVGRMMALMTAFLSLFWSLSALLSPQLNH